MRKYQDAHAAISKRSREEAVLTGAVKSLRHVPNFGKSVQNVIMSQEMLAVQNNKMRSFESLNDKWIDRNSVLAAPLGADVFLSCDRINSILGCPRFFHNDFIIDENKRPDARTRFPYSNEARDAAKKIQCLLARNLMRRNDSAKKLQQTYRTYVAHMRFKRIVYACLAAVSIIQKFYRKRIGRYRQRKKRYITVVRHILTIQAAFRRRREVKRLPAMRAELEARRLKLQQDRLAAAERASKKKRGRERRCHFHAIKIQRWLRGIVWRCWIRKLHTSQIVIAYGWRRFWRRHFRPYGKKIFAFYQACRIRIIVTRIQKAYRGYRGRNKAAKARLLLAAKERQRTTYEHMHVLKKFNSSPLARGEGHWYGENDQDLNASKIPSQMAQIETLTTRILEGKLPSKYVSDEFTQKMDKAQLITLAILSAFANKADGYLDDVALGACKSYLKPVKQKLPHSVVFLQNETGKYHSNPLESTLEVPKLHQSSLVSTFPSPFSALPPLSPMEGTSRPFSPTEGSSPPPSPIESKLGGSRHTHLAPLTRMGRGTKGAIGPPTLDDGNIGGGGGDGADAPEVSEAPSPNISKKGSPANTKGTMEREAGAGIHAFDASDGARNHMHGCGHAPLGPLSRQSSKSSLSSLWPDAKASDEGNQHEVAKSFFEESMALDATRTMPERNKMLLSSGRLMGSGSLAGPRKLRSRGLHPMSQTSLSTALSTLNSTSLTQLAAPATVAKTLGGTTWRGTGTGTSIFGEIDNSSPLDELRAAWLALRGSEDPSELFWTTALAVNRLRIGEIVEFGMFEPMQTVYWRVMLTGRLPPDLILHAVLLRRWTKEANRECVRTVQAYRRAAPPQRACKLCLEPFPFLSQLHRWGGDNCQRLHTMTWVPPAAYKPLVAIFIRKCQHVGSHWALKAKREP